MMCPECGYMMSAFDKECPRCQGKGLPQTPQTQHLPAAVPPPYAAPTVPIQSGHNPAGHGPTGHSPAGHNPASHNPVSHNPAGYNAAAAPAAFAGASALPSPQYCNGCGTPNVGAAAFCAGCGNSLTALAPVAAAPTDSWVAPQPAYPPQSYQQPYPPQSYPPQTYPPAIQQQQSYAPPQQPYGQPIQNNVNVVVTQQNNNSAGWLAALLVLLFGTPLGCIAIPAALVLMAVAFQFTPIIIAALIAVAIGKSTMQQDQKTIAILVTLGVGAVANIALIGAMHSP